MSSLDRAGVEQLVSARLRSLEVLNISKSNLGADSIRLLAHSSWPYLQEIDLSNNQLGSQTLAHLFTAKWQLLVRDKVRWRIFKTPPFCSLTCMLSAFAVLLTGLVVGRE